MMQLFRELKRRNVYKVVVTYAAVAFVTLQAACTASSRTATRCSTGARNSDG